jgi:two-component sensor histidine kinase
MNDQEKSREQLLQELSELRQQVAEFTADSTHLRRTVVARLREEVWKMKRPEDTLQVALSAKNSLTELGVSFLAFGINVAKETPEGMQFHDYTGGKTGKSVPPAQAALLETFWRGNHSFYRPDIQTEDLYDEEPFLSRWKVRSVLDVPFSHGTVAISSRNPNAFSAQDIETLEEFAQVLSESFQRMEDLRVLEEHNRELQKEAVVRERRERQQQAGFQVREQVWEMRRVEDIEQVLGIVGDSLRIMEIPFMYCGVNLVDLDTGMATSLYTMNPEGEWQKGPISGGPLIARFWKGQKPIYRRDLHREDPYDERSRIGRVRSLVDMPFSHGTLAISSREPEAFSEEDLGVLEYMARILSEGFWRLEDLQTLEGRNRELELEVGERRRAEEQIRASLREKEVLLKEIHHRVKNNLQIVSSLLSLQTRYIEDEEVVSSLNDSRTRVESMALVHEKLYQSDDLAQIDFGEYIHTLASYVFDSFESLPQAVQLRVEADPIPMDVDVAIPCGLIVNELITNSLKHAFADRSGGEIGIELHPCGEGEVRLRIGDDGVGFPPEIDFRRTDSLGMQLVVDLTSQLEGEVQLVEGQGAVFEIVFPLPESNKGNA